MNVFAPLFTQLISIIGKLPGQGVDPQCCANVVTAISNAATAIATAISNAAKSEPAEPPVDLTGIVSALNNVFTTLQSYPKIWQTCCAEMDADLKAIAAAMPAATDLSGVVKALQDLHTDNDVPHAIVAQLMSDGAIDSSYSALLQGTPHTWIKTVEDAGRFLWKLAGLASHINAADPSLTPAERKTLREIEARAASYFKTSAAASGLPTDSVGSAISAAMTKFLNAEDKVFEPIVSGLVGAIAGQLVPAAGSSIQLGSVGVNEDTPIASATGVALTASVMHWVISLFGELPTESITRLTELVAGAIGFEELRDVKIGPLIRNGIAAVAEMNARARFQQTLPGHGAVAGWLGRELVSIGDAQRLAALDGLNSTLLAIETTASQSGLNPRMLLQLIQTGLFTDDDLTDEMTFAGVRPRSRARLVMAAPYLATRSERDQLRSTLENAYAAGLLSDQDLTDQVNAIEQNTDRADLVLRNAKWKRTIAITKDLELEFTTLFKSNLLDDAGLRSNLAGIGLQPEMVDAVAAKAEAQAEGALNKQNIKQAAAIAKATAAEERRAATKNYLAGRLDAAGLTAALVATGMTAIQAAASVALASAQLAGNLRWIHGLQLAPAEATLLRDRVAALTDQRKKNQISDQDYVNGLKALKVPDRYINALRAAADSLLTPKSSAFAVPVQTS